MIKRFGFIFLLILPLATISQVASPQAAARREQTDRLINEIVAEVPNLASAENRSFIYAKLAQIVCRSDRRKANVFLQLAGEELGRITIAANNRPKGMANERLNMFDLTLRRTILTTASSCSARDALQMFYGSRTTALEKAISKQLEYKDVNGVPTLVPNAALQAEKTLEQNLMRLEAEQDPERMIDSMLASIKGPLSPATLGYLRRIMASDQERADSLAYEVVGRLLGENFESNGKPESRLINLTYAILTEHTRTKRPNVATLAFNDAQMLSLLAKMVSHHAAMKSNARYVRQLITIAEKLSPVAASQLRAIEEQSRQNSRTSSQDPEVRRLVSSNAPMEVKIAETKKLQPASRLEVANVTARDTVSTGSYEQAIGVLHELIEDENQLADAVGALNWYYAHQLMNQAKFTEAGQLIDTFPDGNRQAALISLGRSIYQKGRVANREQALAVFGRAKMQLTQKPDTNTEYTTLTTLMQNYLAIDPGEGFRVMEPFTLRVNDLWTAAVTLAAYNNMPNIRQGEYILAMGPPPGIRFDWTVYRLYANSNMERTVALTNTMTNRELRLFLKLQLAEFR
jgi:hypothetical protein